MSYNGVGLRTTRGSGTSGYVQSNLASLGDKAKYDEHKARERKRKKRELEEANDPQTKKMKESVKKNVESDLNDHKMKRDIELQCMKLRIELEEQERDEDEIHRRLNELRSKLTQNVGEAGVNAVGKIQDDYESAEQKAPTGKIEKTLQAIKLNKCDNLVKEQLEVYKYIPLSRNIRREPNS